MDDPGSAAKPEFQRAVEKLESEFRKGLAHGFFELSVTCEVIQEGKRRLTIKAGKSYKFIIGEAELGASKIAK
jgi:hypothetical protein